MHALASSCSGGFHIFSDKILSGHGSLAVELGPACGRDRTVWQRSLSGAGGSTKLALAFALTTT